MLRYLNRGERRYDLKPVPVYRRDRWELQAVIAGRCAPVLLEGSLPAASRSLWLFAPEHHHGWTGPAGETCRIVVFHYDHLPDPLGPLVRAAGGVRVDLDDAQAARLEALHEELGPDAGHPGFLTPIRQERALLEIALIAGAGLEPRAAAGPAASAAQTVERAVAWYDEHMHEGPRLKEVAAAAGTSVSHLRRLFHAATGRSPQAELARRRFQRACFLLRETTMSADEVALASGFEGGSSFSRAFRARLGCPPRRWRTAAVTG